jgi:hypothetical protein
MNGHAQLAQLRSVEPQLSESEITRERLMLEEAVRRVEAEAAQRAHDLAHKGVRRYLVDRREALDRP